MDNQEFFDLYMADTRENLGLISQNILNLESDPTNEEYVQNIFRAAHTIKGSAGQMQFIEIANVTHKLEDLFGAIRDKKIMATSEVIDIVFKTLDCLDLLHDQILDSTIEVDTSVTEDILRLLAGDNNHKTEKSLAEEPSIKVSNDNTSRFNSKSVLNGLMNDSVLNTIKSLDSSYHVYYINAEVESGCAYKGVRMFMLLDALSSVGEVISTSPTSESLESDLIESTSLDIILVSNKNKDSFSEVFNSVLEIDVTECTDITSSFEAEDIALNSADFNNTVSIIEDNAPLKAEPIVEVKNEINTDVKKEDSLKKEDLSPKEKKAPVKSTQNKQKINKDANLYVRVHTKTLDTLLNEQGELLLEYNRLCSVLDRARKNEIEMNELIDILEDVGTNINKINSTQQSIIMSTRMFPLEQLFTVFPRMVRDLSSTLHKKIDLKIEGQDTELDRTILEKVSDPLKHIIRNAVDHGIEMPEERIKAGKPEKGTVTLSAKQESDSVIITIKDDGKGMDPDVLRRKAVEKGLYTQAQVEKLTNEEVYSIIFMPGFSTASKVTEVSGRGVGMDIVRSLLSEIGGVVLIDSKLGEGTTFTVKIPLTLAISQALLVTVEKEKYIVLLNYIQEVTEVNRATDIKRIQHKDHIVIRGEKIYPLVYLRDVYGYPAKKNDVERVILISNNGREIGLVADSFIGQQDIVVKSLNKYFGGQVKYEAGITKLGDGSIPIIVDIPSVMNDF